MIHKISQFCQPTYWPHHRIHFILAAGKTSQLFLHQLTHFVKITMTVFFTNDRKILRHFSYPFVYVQFLCEF